LAHSQLYQNAARAKGFEVVEPDWQDEIDTLQDLVKVKTPEEMFAKAWTALFDRLPQGHPVDCAVIACLDLSGVVRFAAPPVPALDSAVQLANALVRRWLEEQDRDAGEQAIGAARW
jgi:aspartate/glutamate racemase